ncbi:MAG: M3 family oligoendopeptidase [Nitrososphaeraceae archaeon]
MRPKPTIWNLSQLIENHEGKELQTLLKSIEQAAKRIEGERETLKESISSSQFQKLMNHVEGINEQISIAVGYAHLKYASDTSSNEAAALLTKMEMLSADVSNRLLFFDIWFKKQLDDRNANRLINSAPIVYREHLKHSRLLSKFTLSEPEEKIISTLEVSGSGALTKIYDRMTSSLEFVVHLKKGKRFIEKKFSNKEKMLSMIRSTKKEERVSAYKSLLKEYKRNSGVLGEIYFNKVIQWHDEFIKLRGFKRPISVRNTYNNLDDSTVESLLQACRSNAKVFQKYFKEKAAMLGLRKLHRYHLYAPLTLSERYQERFSYQNAVSMVIDTFYDFDGRFGKFATKVFNERHVDSEIRKAKQGGAFCYTVTPKLTPYVLLNFDGRIRDVSTMAHELGHAIHSMAASHKPISVAHAPLPLAETASVFAEILLNDRLRSKLTHKQKAILLASQIDDMYATIMRQAYFTLFEIEAHKSIAEKNANITEVSDLYLRNLEDQFGDSVTVSDDFRWEWLYIPHLYHTPFYCYAYSFGNLLVLSLYQQFRKEGKSSFIPKYYKLLSSGGSRKTEEILSDIGIDISSRDFWQQGFDLVEKNVHELRDLV